MKNIYKLDEASLSRAYQHVVEKKSKSWGMITAFRNANSHDENMADNHELGKKLRDLNLGFFKVEGHWRECQDRKIKYKKCPKDQLVDSTETTFFVPNIKKEDLLKLCREYNQDAVVYGGPETKGNTHLIFNDGSEDNVGQFHPDRIEQAYSKFKGGHTFAFVKDKKPKVTSTDTKLSSMIPSDILNKTIKNPATGNTIKMKTALGYPKDSVVHKNAIAVLKK